MQRRHHLAIPFLHTGLCALLLLGAIALVQGQDQKTDLTGTWSWSVPGRNGGPDRKMSLKFKVDGDKLTGKLISPARGDQTNEIEIKDGKIKDGEFSFTVTRERNGNSFVTKYTGKVSGDTIKGRTSMERNGQTRENDWEAKRDKKEAAK
ncbi:MAG: hypothetical protein ACLQVX_03435 [Limisphaerales bacterium]